MDPMEKSIKSWLAEHEEEFLQDLKKLIAIDSVRGEEKPGAPFGEGPKKALEEAIALCEGYGFSVKNMENYVGTADLDAALPRSLDILAHLDVVPAGEGWEITEPFKPLEKDGILYGRGVSDDKGPMLAGLYAMRAVKELGYPLKKGVRLIMGTNEETGSADLDYYYKREEAGEMSFTPDAEFPIINGEKGNITEYLHFAGENRGAARLHSFTGGLRENMVPESATAVLSGQVPELIDMLDKFAKEHDLRFTYEELANGQISVTIIGKSAHGASPQSGINGATYLAKFLTQFDFEGPAKDYLDVAGNILLNDHDGTNLNIAYVDEKMGSLSMNAGVFRFDEKSTDNTIALNIRYPKGTSPEEIQTVLAQLPVTKVTLSEHGHTPHYVPMEDPLVQTLLSVYEKQTGLKGHEQVIGGGTFGRLLKRGVAYGAMFPDYIDTMHQANEFIDVEDLFRAAAIYAEAIYELIK